MGYTHNWNATDFTDKQWTLARHRMRKIIKQSDVPVQWEADTIQAPEISDSLIRFNGVEEDGHETFYMERGQGGFCKTARKPYDVIVVAALSMLTDVNPEFTPGGDSDPDERTEGEALYKRSM